MNEILDKFKVFLKELPPFFRYLLSALVGAIVGIAMLASCVSCGSAAYVRNNEKATTTITITNEPRTDVQVDVSPSITPSDGR